MREYVLPITDSEGTFPIIIRYPSSSPDDNEIFSIHAQSLEMNIHHDYNDIMKRVTSVFPELSVFVALSGRRYDGTYQRHGRLAWEACGPDGDGNANDVSDILGIDLQRAENIVMLTAIGGFTRRELTSLIEEQKPYWNARVQDAKALEPFIKEQSNAYKQSHVAHDVAEPALAMA